MLRFILSQRLKQSFPLNNPRANLLTDEGTGDAFVYADTTSSGAQVKRSFVLQTTMLATLIVTTWAQAPRSFGTHTTFDAPGAFTTVAYYVNASGTVTWYLIDVNNHESGYLRAPDGSFTIFDDAAGSPGSSQDTIPMAINASDTVAGIYNSATNQGESFVKTRFGAFTDFTAPGPTTNPGTGTQLTQSMGRA